MNEQAFRQSLVDSCTVVSVLLVFLSVLFGLKYERVREALSDDIPDRVRPNDRGTFRGTQRRCFIADVLPVGIPSLFLAFLLGPACWRIVRLSHLSFPGVDLVLTLFLAIEACIMIVVLWSVTVSAWLWVRVNKDDEVQRFI